MEVRNETTDNQMERAFAEAARIARKMPKNLQEAAFNRALDELLGALKSQPNNLVTKNMEKTPTEKIIKKRMQDVQEKKEATSKKGTKTRKASRPGPKVVVTQLLENGFFSSPRLIMEIRDELQHQRGYKYTIQNLSPALVRLVRDESLKRKKNQSGQYEYSKN